MKNLTHLLYENFRYDWQTTTSRAHKTTKLNQFYVSQKRKGNLPRTTAKALWTFWLGRLRENQFYLLADLKISGQRLRTKGSFGSTSGSSLGSGNFFDPFESEAAHRFIGFEMSFWRFQALWASARRSGINPSKRGNFLWEIFRGSLAPSPKLSGGITRIMPWGNFSSGGGLSGVFRNTDILLFASSVKTQNVYKIRDKLKPANFGINDFRVSHLLIKFNSKFGTNSLATKNERKLYR